MFELRYRVDFDPDTDEAENKIFDKAFKLEKSCGVDVIATRGGPAHYPYVTFCAMRADIQESRTRIMDAVRKFKGYVNRFKTARIMYD